VIQFKDSSYIIQDTSLLSKYDKIIGWEWDFGDGTTHSNLKNPAKAYFMNGTFLVKLKIFTEQGGTDTVSHLIYIAGPVPDFELAAGQNDTVFIPNLVKINIRNSSDTTYRTLLIRWGDGLDSIMTKPVKATPFSTPGQLRHSYSNPGRYCIKISATDSVLNEFGQMVPCTRDFPCDTCPEFCFVIIDTSKIGIRTNYNTLNNIKVYPNPGKGIYQVESNEETNIIVYNLSGQEILSTSSKTVDLRKFEDGLYIFRIITKDGRVGIYKVEMLR
jgi:PKD repeat protein